MSDREALAASVRRATELIDDDVFEVGAHWHVLVAAARERLAQLPEKCDHGQSELHYPATEHSPYKDFLDKAMHEYYPKTDPPTYSQPDLCPGKVYPAETVERIEVAIYESVDRWIKDYSQLVPVVLDALNGETP